MARIFAHTRYGTPSPELRSLQEYIASLKAELESFATTTAYDEADAARRSDLATKVFADVRRLNERARHPWWRSMLATRRRTA